MLQLKLNDAEFKMTKGLENLTHEAFSEIIYRTTFDSRNKVMDHFRAIKNEADQQKDAISTGLIREWGGKEAFLQMKKDYTNVRLEEILTNRREKGIIEWNNQLIRKMTPIYMEPLSRFGRAHFFAPVKKLGNVSIDTFWFNLIIIWFSACVYYLTLVFDLLRKFTNWNQIRKLRRRM